MLFPKKLLMPPPKPNEKPTKIKLTNKMPRMLSKPRIRQMRKRQIRRNLLQM